MTMSSTSRLLKDNGSPCLPLRSLSNTRAPAPPIPNVTFARISVTMDSPAPCMSALPAGNWHQVTWHIIIWQPNVISVIDGDILMKFAIFGSVEDAMPQGMWSITARSIRLPSQTLKALMGEPIQTTTTSIPVTIYLHQGGYTSLFS